MIIVEIVLNLNIVYESIKFKLLILVHIYIYICIKKSNEFELNARTAKSVIEPGSY